MDKIIQFFRQPVVWLYSFELWIILLITIFSLALIVTIILLVVKKIKSDKEIKSIQPVKSVNVVVKDKAPQQEAKQSTEKAVPEKKEEEKEEEIYIKQSEQKPVKSGSIPKINNKDEFEFDLEEFDVNDKDAQDNTLTKEEARIQEIADNTPAPEPKMYEAVLNNISKTDDVKDMIEISDVDEDKKEITVNEDEASFITDTKEVNVITEDVNETEIEDRKPVGGNLSELDFDDVTMPKESDKDNEFDIEELESVNEKDDKTEVSTNADDEFDVSEFDITDKDAKMNDKDNILATQEALEIDNEKVLKGAKAVPAVKVIPKKPRKEPVKEPIAKSTSTKTTVKTTKTAAKTPIKPLPVAAKIKETDKTAVTKKEPKAGSTGKFEIYKQNDKYKFSLVANNGTLLFESLSYSSLATCKNAVGTFKKNVEAGEFSIEKNQNGFYYVLKKGNTIYYGVTYNTEKSCKSGIESVKKFAESAVIILKD